MREFITIVENHWGPSPSGKFLDLYTTWEDSQPDQDNIHTEFEKWGEDEVYIDLIQIADHVRGTGLARRVMEAIISCAHEAKVLLTLTPVWQDDETDDNRSPLSNWYHGFGFERGLGNHLSLDCREEN